MNKAVVSLNIGLEYVETVTVAFLVAVGAAEQGRPTLMLLTKEAVRLATQGLAKAVACDGCPPLAELFERYEKADGRLLVCPICVKARNVDATGFVAPRRGWRHRTEVGGTVPMWQWIGDEGAVTFSY